MNKIDRSTQIKVGAILSYASILVNILAGLLYTPWMINKIGQSQYGLFTLANTLISLFMIDFGLSSATAKYVSQYHAKGDEESVNKVLGAIYKLYLAVDMVIFVALIVVYFFIDYIYIKLTPIELEQFKIVYCIAGLYSITSFPFITLNGILTSYEKFIQQKFAELFYRIIQVSLTIVALLMGFKLYALVTVNALAGLISIFYKIYVVHKTTPIKVRFTKVPKGFYKEILGFSLWVTVASLAQRLVFNITPSILGAVASSASIAIFGIITTIEGYSFTITNAINGMFMPKISRIYSGNDSEQGITNLMIKVGKFQYIINGLIFAGFLVVGKEFIVLWMGKDFLYAYYGILLVIFPGLFYNSLQIAHTAMIVQGKVKIQAIVNVVMGIVNVILSVILSSRYGVLGASVSIFVAYMLRAVLLNIIYKYQLNIDIGVFIKKCYIGLAPMVIITCIVGVLIKNRLIIDGWMKLAINAVLVVFIYFVTLFTCGLDKEEKNKFKDIIKGIK